MERKIRRGLPGTAAVAASEAAATTAEGYAAATAGRTALLCGPGRLALRLPFRGC